MCYLCGLKWRTVSTYREHSQVYHPGGTGAGRYSPHHYIPCPATTPPLTFITGMSPFYYLCTLYYPCQIYCSCNTLGFHIFVAIPTVHTNDVTAGLEHPFLYCPRIPIRPQMLTALQGSCKQRVLRTKVNVVFGGCGFKAPEMGRSESVSVCASALFAFFSPNVDRVEAGAHGTL